MIDYIALTIGHGLLGFALWQLFMRADVDVDPLLDEIGTAAKTNRQLTSTAARNAARRASDEAPPRSSSASGLTGKTPS